MNLQNGAKSLLEKEMDRKEFLKLIGMGLVAVTGITSLLKTFSALNSDSSSSTSSSFGYGSSPYGGGKNT